MLIILKISILYKLMCRFYATEIKIPVEFLDISRYFRQYEFGKRIHEEMNETEKRVQNKIKPYIDFDINAKIIQWVENIFNKLCNNNWIAKYKKMYIPISHAIYKINSK